MASCWSCSSEIPGGRIRERPFDHPHSLIRKSLPGAQGRMGYGRCPGCGDGFYIFYNGREQPWVQPDMLPVLEDAFPPDRSDRVARRKREWIRAREEEMRAFFSPRPRGGRREEAARDRAPRAARDPWQILGVPRGSTREEAEKAFRRRAKECHPDRVARLDPEIRDLAHEKFLELQDALDAVLGEIDDGAPGAPMGEDR